MSPAVIERDAPLTTDERSLIIGKRFSEILKEHGVITEEQYNRCYSIEIEANAAEAVVVTVRTYLTVAAARALAADGMVRAETAKEAGTP